MQPHRKREMGKLSATLQMQGRKIDSKNFTTLHFSTRARCTALDHFSFPNFSRLVLAVILKNKNKGLKE